METKIIELDKYGVPINLKPFSREYYQYIIDNFPGTRAEACKRLIAKKFGKQQLNLI